MAKGKRGSNSNGNGNDRKDYINSVMESARAQKERIAVERKEAARQEAMSTMTEEEKKLFMSQEEILEKEKDVAGREEELRKGFADLDQKKGEQADKEKSLSEREKRIVSDEEKIADDRKKLDRRQSDLDSQERNLIERENNAEAGFTVQNQRSLEALRKSQEELRSGILALQEKKIQAESELQEELQRIREQKLARIEKEMEAYRKSMQVEVDVEVKSGRGFRLRSLTWSRPGRRYRDVSSAYPAHRSRLRHIRKENVLQTALLPMSFYRELNCLKKKRKNWNVNLRRGPGRNGWLSTRQRQQNTTRLCASANRQGRNWRKPAVNWISVRSSK